MPISSLLTTTATYLLMLGGFNFTYTPQTDTSGTAKVEITSEENLTNVKVRLVGDNGEVVERVVIVRPGKPGVVTFKQSDREVKYDMVIEASEAYTEAQLSIRKPVAGGKQGNFKVLSDRNEIVDGRKIRYKTPFTLSSTSFTVFDTEGNPIVDEQDTETVYKAGETITKTWCSTEEVFMIKFRGEDDIGANSSDIRVPWAVHIPHTEVQFPSGKATINANEAGKIDEAYAVLAHELDGLEKINAAVNSNLTAQLYIVGYTDTVGNAAANRKLSEQRARAIAKYFQKKGAWCEIHYAGMGENGLAVQTGDNVDKQENRRALYLLGVQKPAGGGQVPGPSKWKKLSDASARPAGALPELPESYHAYKEKTRKARIAKYAGSSCSGPGGASSGGSAMNEGSSNFDSSTSNSVNENEAGNESQGDDGDGSQQDPPEMAHQGGAAHGCAVVTRGESGPMGMLVAFFGLMGLRRARRGVKNS